MVELLEYAWDMLGFGCLLILFGAIPFYGECLMRTNDRMLLIAAALNGILSRGAQRYKDGPFTLDTDNPERIACLAVRIADQTLEIANERLSKQGRTNAGAHRLPAGHDSA